MSIAAIAEFHPGPITENGEFMIDQERQARDIELTNRVKAGYSPAKKTPDNPKPRIIDGELTEDAQAALGELWRNYQPLATRVASDLRGRIANWPAIEVDDLIDEGYFSLYETAVTWVPSKKASFLTRARRYMCNDMRRVIQNQEFAIRVPLNKQAQIRQVGSIAWHTYNTQHRFPGREEIAEKMKKPETAVENLKHIEAMTREMGSLEGGYFTDDRDGPSIYDAGEARWKSIDPTATEARLLEDEFLVNDLIKIVGDMLTDADLTPDERYVLRRRFSSEPTSLGEIVAETGVPLERVRQVEAHALAKLRRLGRLQSASDYLHEY